MEESVSKYMLGEYIGNMQRDTYYQLKEHGSTILMGPPRATNEYSEQELRIIDYVGVYKPMED